QIADHYALAGRNEPAVVFYRRAGAAAQRIYANSEAIRLYQLLLSGELASALSPAEACEVRLALGEVWRVTGDWAHAEQINLEAMRMAESQGDTFAVARARRALADVMRLQGHYDAALEWLTEAEAGFAASQDWRGVVSALWTAGEIYWFKGDHVQALSALERQLRIASQHDDQRGICEALDTLGMVYWSQGDWDQSLECCHRSIAIAEPLGYHLVITRADITIGNVYSSQKGANEAVHWWLQAGLLAQQIDDRQVLTWAIANIAGMAANCGDLLTALIGHEQAILLATEIGDRWTACLNIADLGNVLEQLHREKMAEFLYRQAVALGRALDIPSYLAGMLVDLASLLLRQGRATEATAVHAEAITMLARVEGRRLAGADRRFEADLLGVQLGKASGALTPDDAEQQIRGLLQEYAEPAQRAALHDELWQVAPTNQAARATAADLYRALYAGTAHDRYRQRHFELTAIALPDPPPLPDVSKLIPPRSPDIDGLLERLAPLLAQLEVSFNG
ncbi:MAG: tetratricopeptide repeat protein, partial [Caldilineaceae bacterium]|nr:tetratricopeptide repeat protein [Caldilineaceae bacterium]